ncbi:MAG: substrate-binding domain-containing protein [Sciscionella sp.]
MPAAASSATRRRHGTIAALATAAALLPVVAGCGAPGGSNGSHDAPIKVGLVYSKTGPLASYGKQYYQGFQAGLHYATHGTSTVNGRKIEVSVKDDTGDPAKAVAAAKDLIGNGDDIIAGSVVSGIAVQLAPIAKQNQVLFISGPAATDAVTGANRYTFRSGRQTYQDILTAKSFIGNASGKHVVVLAQDDAFGHANVTAVKQVLGAQGARVSSVLAPEAATDLTPFATQARNAKPDLLFVAWAGTNATALWTALNQQGVLDSTTTVTGLDQRSSYPVFAATHGKVSFLAHYVPGGTHNAAADAMRSYLTAHGEQSDLFTPDGFTAAQMIVRAAGHAGDVNAMITSLQGWSFNGVKGGLTIRKADHALLQPMFQAKLNGTTPEIVKTIPAGKVAPPVHKMG